MDYIATSVFIGLFLLVTVIGFFAGRWRSGDLDQLHEWGLGGRRFGTLITWFLLGGDLYTAYTFVAVPALMFGAGAVGFFAVPYTILIYPILFMVFPRMWEVAQRNGYITAADFVKGRFENQPLALAIAITGLLATMPYIALQLVGMEVIIAALGLHLSGFWSELPLIIAFIVLAAFTYASGLRAPAMIAVVKDMLIYVAVIAAVVIIPMKLGGYGKIFSSISPEKLILPHPEGASLGGYSAYATLALGSALALFLYPHSLTALLSSSSRQVIRRNAAILPTYSFLLGLLALLGFMAIAAGVQSNPAYAAGFAEFGANFSVPALFLDSFPSWFVGLAFAAIAIGALVPAAIMSIACANLFTRNIYKEYINPRCTDAQESRMAKLISLIVKAGALVFVLSLDKQFAIQFQLLGGIWIIQTLPAVMIGLFTRWLNGWALLAGWATGIIIGTGMAASLGFKGSIYPLDILGYMLPGYAAFYSLIINLALAIILTPLFNMVAPGSKGRALEGCP